MIAKVLVDRSVKKLNKVYDYKVPSNLENCVQIGMRVKINFGIGKGQELEAIIVKLDNEEKDNVKYKYILEVLDSQSYITLEKLKLAKWMAKMYFCNVYDVLKLMLPPSSKGVLESKDFKGKQAKILGLKLPQDVIEQDIESGKIKSARHIKLLRYLMENEYIFLDDAKNTLGISQAIINTVEKNGYIYIEYIDIDNEDYSNIPLAIIPTPTEEQQEVISNLSNTLDKQEYNVSLLYGVTGSRENRGIFKTNTKMYRYEKNSNCACARNSTYYTNKT